MKSPAETNNNVKRKSSEMGDNDDIVLATPDLKKPKSQQKTFKYPRFQQQNANENILFDSEVTNDSQSATVKCDDSEQAGQMERVAEIQLNSPFDSFIPKPIVEESELLFNVSDSLFDNDFIPESSDSSATVTPEIIKSMETTLEQRSSKRPSSNPPSSNAFEFNYFTGESERINIDGVIAGLITQATQSVRPNPVQTVEQDKNVTDDLITAYYEQAERIDSLLLDAATSM